MGRIFKGCELRGWGLAPNQKYVLCLRVWAMGDLNSVDVAQSTHEAILKGAGCLKEGCRLEFGKPVPHAETVEGVYVDDHLLISRVPSHRLKHPGAAADTALLEASRRGYRAAGLPRAEETGFEREADFVAWGSEVRGVAGKCGAPRARRLHLMVLGFLLIGGGTTTRVAMESLGYRENLPRVPPA